MDKKHASSFFSKSSFRPRWDKELNSTQFFFSFKPG